MVELTRKEYNIIAKNWGIIEPQNISTQELKIILEKNAKIQNISKNELNKAEKLQNMN